MVRIYHNLSDASVLDWKLNHVDLCNVTAIRDEHRLGDMFAMTWRFLPLIDPLVDVFMSRDADSPIIDREVVAVKQWLASDAIFHALRDHPQHCMPFLAGSSSFLSFFLSFGKSTA